MSILHTIYFFITCILLIETRGYALKLNTFCKPDAYLKIRMNQNPEDKETELSALVYLLNSTPGIRDQIISKDDLVHEGRVTTFPVCVRFFLLDRIPKQIEEIPPEDIIFSWRMIQRPISFRMLISYLSLYPEKFKLTADARSNSLKDMYSHNHRPLNPMKIPTWVIPEGISGVLQPSAIRVLSAWPSKGIETQFVLESHDLASNPKQDLPDEFEKVFDNNVLLRQNPVALKADAHEVLNILPNGFFYGTLFDARGNVADNAPLSVVSSAADIRHPSLACLQCHGHGSISNANSIMSKAYNVNQATLDTLDLKERTYPDPEFTHFRTSSQLRFTNQDYLDLTREINDTYQAALASSQFPDGPLDLYNMYLKYSNRWTMADIADEFGVSLASAQAALEKLSDKYVTLKFSRKSVPLALIIEAEPRSAAGLEISNFYYDLAETLEPLDENL